MALGRITVKLRPLRHLFLVPPGNRRALLRAIHINTFLWGGMFNPIVPAFSRRPGRWHDALLRRVPAREIVAGYVDAFDPDYLVRVGDISAGPAEVERQVVTADQILEPVREDGAPQYGVGLLEVIDEFCREELKFVRRQPLEIVLPYPDRRHELFLSAVFGALPQEIEQDLLERYGQFLAPTRPSVTVSNYFELLDRGKLFWRRLSAYRIRPTPRRVPLDGETLFLLDADSTTDILDYWNLRAAGWRAYPVAKQAVGLESLRERLLEIVEQNFAPYRSNPKLYRHVEIVPSQSCSKKEVSDFLTWLDIPPPPQGVQEPKWVIGYYPRLWDEWARSRGEEPSELEADRMEHQLSTESERIDCLTVAPTFLTEFGGRGTHRYANEIELQYFGAAEMMAEVIPQGPASLVRAIGGIGFDDWRFAKSGLVYLSEYKRWNISLTPPLAEDVFREWLKSKGWQPSISPAGRIAKQMLKQLGGIWGTEPLANRRLIGLLDQMSQGKTLGKTAFWGEMQRLAQAEKYFKDPLRILEGLSKAQVFQLGLQLKCPICLQHSWYSLKEADYQLRCPKCLELFPVPEHSPQDIEWAYRTIGPFSLPNRSYGVYCVLLTLRFFGRVLRERLTPMLSFEAKKNSKSLEADLGLFVRETAWWRPEMQIVFCECKTFNKFTERDARRMREIAREFPAAVLVFATLNDALSRAERKLLRPLANRGRRHWKANKSLNPVLILTANELFGDSRPEHVWREMGARHAQVAEQIGWAPGILKLCDATQQLYLDMPPWFQWLEDRMRRRRRRLQARMVPPADPRNAQPLSETGVS